MLRLSHMFQLSQKLGQLQMAITQQRNMCVVLGCIAEKLAGPSSIAILSDATLDYLVSNLVSYLINVSGLHVYLYQYILKSIFQLLFF